MSNVSLPLAGFAFTTDPLERADTLRDDADALLRLWPQAHVLVLDPDGRALAGDDGQPLALFESGAILLYLAEKSGKLIPQEAAGRYHVIQWVMFQIGGIGPMFGQLGFFHKFAGKDYEDKRPRDRYADESRRLLRVLEHQLGRHAWVAGDDYSIADIAVFPWLNGLMNFYQAGELVGAAECPHVTAALERFLARPAVQAGF